MENKSTIAIVAAILIVGGVLFAQNLPPKELDATEIAQIEIDCIDDASGLLVSGYLEPGQSNAYVSYCTREGIKDATTWW